eukprot:m.70168 g.70168  ORF g.70168 m.70168 type:complete len:235 (+) comp7863_c0_seq2:73-777(+)
MASSTIRISTELRQFQRSNLRYARFYGLHLDQLHEWIVLFIGPEGTLYEGGIFQALIRFPSSFPMDPPSVQFLGEFFHPNVYRDGKVCISTLQQPIPRELRSEDQAASLDDRENWTPALNIESVCMSVISMLSDPNPSDPANADAAKLYTTNPEEFRLKVREMVDLSVALLPDDYAHAMPGNHYVEESEDPAESLQLDSYDPDMDEFEFESDGDEYEEDEGGEDGVDDDDTGAD